MSIVSETIPTEQVADKITPDPRQPRIVKNDIKELAQNIEEVGQQEPIHVDLNYIIVDGERRWLAVQKIGHPLDVRRHLNVETLDQRDELRDILEGQKREHNYVDRAYNWARRAIDINLEGTGKEKRAYTPPQLKEMLVICQICGAERKIIHNSHLKIHGMTVDEYRNMFPSVEMVSQEYRDVISESQIGRKPWNTGKTRAEDPRIPQPWLGKSRSQKTRDKISVIITELWKDPEYVKRQERTLYQRIVTINRNRQGRTLEEIYGVERGKELRQVWSDSHKGLKQSKETIAKRVTKISGENHYLYGRQQPLTQRMKHSRSMKKLFDEGNLDGKRMIKIAKGDNPAENRFAMLHPQLKRQACIVLPTEVIIRERSPGVVKGGLLRYFVDFLDEESNIVYEIDDFGHYTDVTKMQKDGRKDRILNELGYDVVRIRKEDVLN